MDLREQLFKNAAVRERLFRQMAPAYKQLLAKHFRQELERRMQDDMISTDQLLDLIAEVAVKYQLAKRNSNTLWNDLVLTIAIYSEELCDTRAKRDVLESTLPGDVRRQVALLGAQAKLERDADGKQAAKRGAKDMWARWETNELRYRSIAAFARDVIKNFPVLENPKTIEKWVREWRGGSDAE
jgi:hypothetical protein